MEARRKLGLDPGAEAVVYLGRMDVKKGLRELVEAAAALRPAAPTCTSTWSEQARTGY